MADDFGKYYIVKLLLAGITAFVILNVFCFFYYNPPIHFDSSTFSTDYIWERNMFYSRGTEGFALGKTDENGFNNKKSFKAGDIDVLLMGSSHMEAFNVAQNKNCAYIMGDKLDRNVYNIGISGHSFLRCIYNIENAVREFKPKNFIVIESLGVPEYRELTRLTDNEYERIESADGILSKLQNFPYFRLLYLQYSNYKESISQNSGKAAYENRKVTDDNYEEKINYIMKKTATYLESKGLGLIVFLNNPIDINDTGEVIIKKHSKERLIFEKACIDNNIEFIDMFDNFASYYNDSCKLPRGFSNTKIGYGHINAYGHRIIADTLSEKILDMEDKK